MTVLDSLVPPPTAAAGTRLRLLETTPAPPPAAPLGVSAAFRSVVALARRVAQTDASVFITGESGVGKELIAQLIHQSSERADRPLVAVNCAALPESLLESEMFGHVKGAFTGAVRTKPGLLETADGGTMLLDELTEMARPLQAKLLRVVEDGVVRRVGSERPDAVVDIRFIAATNRDPAQAVRAGQLREDLFYRLQVVPIQVPPLRDRPEDIPVLAEHFLARAWRHHRDPDQPAPTIGAAALAALCAHSWPGNARQLENVIERAAVLAEPGGEIAVDALALPSEQADRSRGAEPPADAGAEVGAVDRTYREARRDAVARFERQYLAWVLRRAEGNIAHAARTAGMNRSTLYRLLERHEFVRAWDNTAAVA